MAERYFFTHGEAQQGPYSADEMREQALAGKILPTDSVWQDGMKQRFPASVVQNLFEDLVAPDDAVDDDAGVEPGVAPAADTKPAVAGAKEMEGKPSKRPDQERPKRVVSIKGGVLCSQDGKHVQFRKKCTVCGYEEQGRTNQVIRAGAMKIAFFCRKCRKGRVTEMTGTT
jgi:hypothetical protein